MISFTCRYAVAVGNSRCSITKKQPASSSFSNFRPRRPLCIFGTKNTMNGRFTHSPQMYQSLLAPVSDDIFAGVSLCTNDRSSNMINTITCIHNLCESVFRIPSEYIESLSTSHDSLISQTDRTHTRTDIPLNQHDGLFRIDLPEGTCVGLRLHSYSPRIYNDPHPKYNNIVVHNWIQNLLHPDEVSYGISLPTNVAKDIFFLGRLVMRVALQVISTSSDVKKVKSSNDNNYEQEVMNMKWNALPLVMKSHPSILKDKHGRPIIPKGYLGSISHKKMIGVALVSLDTKSAIGRTPRKGIGVDIEETNPRRRSIAKKVLTVRELEDLGHLKGVTRDEEVLLRFSLKESVYKAMHPLICQWVGFQEAEIIPYNDGTATVILNIKGGVQKMFSHVKTHWKRLNNDFFLTSSSVMLKDEYF